MGEPLVDRPLIARSNPLGLVAPAAIAVAIFLVDSLTRLGGAVAVLYTAVILMVANGGSARRILWTGAACALLTLIGFAPVHLPEAWGSSHVRLVVSLAAILIVTLLAVRTRSAEANFDAQARVLDLTHDTVIIREAGDIICYWNDGAAELYGFTRDQALGVRCQDLLKTTLPVPRSEIDAVLATEGTWTGEIVRTREDGRRIILASRWSLRIGPNGPQIIETSADVTEQRRLDQRYQDIFHAAGFALWEADWSVLRRAARAMRAEGVSDLEAHLLSIEGVIPRLTADIVVNDINGTALKLFEADGHGDLAGRSMSRIFTPVTEAAFARAITQLDEGAEKVELETHYLSLKGRRIEALIRVTVPEDDPEWKRVLVTALDLTERNRIQAKLNETIAELSHASRISMLGELAASIAHEVNQPLAAVVTYGEASRRWLSREPIDKAELADCIDHILSNGRRATDVIGRVRALAKNAAGQTSALSLAAVAHEAAELMEREMRLHGVVFREDIAGDLPPVLGDRVQLQQVIINLLMNGVQAMADTPPGGREMTLRLAREGDHLRLAICDRGSGIAPDEAGKLFRSFMTTKADGLGMGLSICRSIIEAHHGQITLTNNEGPGATAAILLPIAPTP